MRKLSRIFVCCVMVAAGLVAGSGSAAAAGPLDLKCVGDESATYKPGLLFTSRPTAATVDHTYKTCFSPSDPTIKSGSVVRTLHTSISCTALGDNRAGSMTIAWNNGRSSTIDYTIPLRETAVIVYFGVVTKGQFAGDGVIITVAYYYANLLACLAPPGMTSTEAVISLEIMNV